MNQKNKLAIIMLGAPGSGKGTQGELLEQHTGFIRYVMSDIIKKQNSSNKEIHKKITQGILLDDTDIFSIFRNSFKSEDQIIIDGVPRTLDQAYWLYGFLLRHKYKIELIFLNVDEKKLQKRITSRLYCPKCHTGYNTLTLPPKKKGVCDKDQEKLIQRPDDTPKIFKQRIKTFNHIKDVILDVYKAEILEINADQEINKVSQDLIKKIILN